MSSPQDPADGYLVQDRLDRAFRSAFDADPRIRAALTYGSRPAGAGDAWSDVEYWAFVDDATLPGLDPRAWIAAVAEPDLLVHNEFGAWVAVYDDLVRLELHFWPASDVDVVRGWPSRGAPLERMVLLDHDGTLVPALAALPERAPVPTSAAEVAEVCGRFANWWVLGHNVLRRGEYERAQDALSHVRRYLLWMARLREGATERWLTPSRCAEADLSAELVAAIGALGVPSEPTALTAAYRAAWDLGGQLWRELAAAWGFDVPTRLLARAVS
ncbi:hypothetical protein [Actinopolymorpha pittospori]|uniref:Lincosamide nucleotidyltransferase n=1 Tax=Actinopolymorpha pittospori TaxID=648752 RepID=A0A927N5K6_9ACTN|nr:hypothetical protein [Actinopolymorpha pittospori]MBE1610678.1 lincosamide nucleotidyltransferase [Actinopolymorpha pittospori]